MISMSKIFFNQDPKMYLKLYQYNIIFYRIYKFPNSCSYKPDL